MLDARVAERLVGLEIDDIDVPEPPGQSSGAPLYFRILMSGQGLLRVELWELGAPRGARSVSSAGTDTLRARRIALVAGELARQLRRKRLAEIAAASRAPSEGPAPAAPEKGIPVYGRFALDAGARGAALGPSDAWVVGPALAVDIAFTTGFRLSLGGAWLAGRAPDLGGSARFLEVTLSGTERLFGTPRAGFSAGAEVGAASVRLGDAHDAGAAAPLDTWSARAGIVTRLELSFGRAASMLVGPDVAVVLRPIRAVGDDGASHRVGGLWLGGTVAFAFEPL